MSTHLGDYLEKLRREIREKAERVGNVLRPHRFPCPYCARDVDVEYKPDGSQVLKHRCSMATPGKNYNVDLLNAFVHHCRPPKRFGAIDELEDEARKVLR